MLSPFVLGFQRDTIKEGLSTPYVLIHWVRKGHRTSEQNVKAMMELDLKAVSKSQSKEVKSLLSESTIGHSSYDAARHIVWLDVESEATDTIGRSRSLAATFATEQGMLQVAGYFMAADAEADLPAFHQIVDSVAISPDIAYRARRTDGLMEGDQKRFTVLQTLCWLAGLVVFLLVIRQRQRTHEQLPPTLK